MNADPQGTDRAGVVPRLSLPLLALAWIALGALGLVMLAPALDGAFFGDDLLYTWNNPWVRDIDARRALEILDPWGDATRYVTNYAPIHLLAHAAEMQLFGEWPRPYHVVNIGVHATGSLLLGLFFVRRGIPGALAAIGALLFFVHPANVEAVAWVNQLKTTLSLALALGALLLFERNTALSCLAFAFALLSKATAAVALPVAALLLWIDWPGLPAAERRTRATSIAVWTLLLGLFALGQAGAFQGANASVAPIHESPVWRAASSIAIAGQYLWMAVSGSGLSTFHQPAPVESMGDARLWLSLAAAALIAGRSFVSLRRRSNEVVFWAFAVVSWGPVSQLFPFLYPLADRYLYFMLPGLIGATLWLVAHAAPPAARRFALPVAAIACLGFAVAAHARAAVWRDATTILGDAASHYPDGLIALGMRARAQVADGRIDEGVASLRLAIDRGFEGLEQLLVDPVYRAHRGDPRIDAVLRELARIWVERLEGRNDLTQIQWSMLARAQLVSGDVNRARESYRAGIRAGGPLSDTMRRDLQALVRRVRESHAEGVAP